MQLADVPVPESVQEPAVVPGQLTIPVGVEGVPVSVSVTVAVQVNGCPSAALVTEQVTVVVVDRRLTVIVVAPWVASCEESPT